MTTHFEIRLAKFLGYCLEKCKKSPFSINYYHYDSNILSPPIDYFGSLVDDEFEYYDLVKSLRGLVDL